MFRCVYMKMFRLILKKFHKIQIHKRNRSTITSATIIKSSDVGVIGVPFDKGQKKFGVNNGPKILRDSGLLKILENNGSRNIVDYGDISYCSSIENLKNLDNMNNLNDVIACNKTLFYKIQQILNDNNDQFIVLGGDHSVAIGSIGGHLAYDPNVAVLWIDAHADINLNTSSNSGSIHGMPVALLLEELKGYWNYNPTENWLKNRLSANRLAYIGLRDIDPYEVELIKKHNITAFGMDAIDKFGIGRIMEICLDRIDPKGKLNYHVSFDVDGLDPYETPSTGTPVTCGLTLREGLHIMEVISDTKRLRGMDIVEINPNLGTQNNIQRTVQTSIEIVKAAFGQSSRINTRNYWSMLK